MQIDTIMHGDCLALLRTLPDASVDAIVTDPPYGLGEAPDVAAVLGAWLAGESFVPRNRGGFMGKAWDAFVPGPEYWRAAYRVLKPGGHLVAFAGTRTEDVMGISIRLAGFERRDTLYWIHGQGFPKSLDVSKQIDKAAGARREVVGVKKLNERDKVAYVPSSASHFGSREEAQPRYITAPATEAARQWDGWGTALKPAVEPIILARKPLSEPTVAANVLRWGTGALHVDACRVPHVTVEGGTLAQNTHLRASVHGGAGGLFGLGASDHKPAAGRWPPHLLLSHSLFCTAETCADGCPVRELGRQSGTDKARPTAAGVMGYQRAIRGAKGRKLDAVYGDFPDASKTVTSAYDDTGTCARYFPQFRYVAKASRRERNAGCEGLPVRLSRRHGDTGPSENAKPNGQTALAERNSHPTVKPLALMRWLITLITPPGGIVLDPFSGSGTTLLAAQQLGMHWLGIEQEREYIAIARARLGMREEATA